MAFSFTWDVTIPADAEDINLGANRIRAFKSAIQERVAVNHSFAGDANDGLHLHSEYVPRGSAPTPVNATDGVVYVAVVSGVAELFYKDTAGHTLQLTKNGALQLVAATATGGFSVTGGMTVSGNVDISAPATTDLVVDMSVDATQAIGVQFRTAEVPRWLIQKDAVAESGGNAGSDLNVICSDDAGAVIAVALKILRASGYLVLPTCPQAPPAGVSRAVYEDGAGGPLRITP